MNKKSIALMTAVIFAALCIMPGAMYAQDKKPDNAATVQGQGQTEAQVSQQAPSGAQPAQADQKAAPETAAPVQQAEPEAEPPKAHSRHRWWIPAVSLSILKEPIYGLSLPIYRRSPGWI